MATYSFHLCRPQCCDLQWLYTCMSIVTWLCTNQHASNHLHTQTTLIYNFDNNGNSKHGYKCSVVTSMLHGLLQHYLIGTIILSVPQTSNWNW